MYSLTLRVVKRLQDLSKYFVLFWYNRCIVLNINSINLIPAGIKLQIIVTNRANFGGINDLLQ